MQPLLKGAVLVVAGTLLFSAGYIAGRGRGADSAASSDSTPFIPVGYCLHAGDEEDCFGDKKSCEENAAKYENGTPKCTGLRDGYRTITTLTDDSTMIPIMFSSKKRCEDERAKALEQNARYRQEHPSERVPELRMTECKAIEH